MSRDDTFELSYSAADAKRVLVLLLACEILLVFSYCVVHIFAPGVKWGPIKLFVDVDREAAIPTWLSTVQLFAIGILFLLHAVAAKQLRLYFIIFGLGFLFLSMDEAAVIHEKIIDSAKRVEWQWLLFLTLKGSHKAWMIPYVATGVLALGVSYRFLLFLWRNARRESILFVIGIAIFCIGGIGLELLAFYFEEAPTDTPYAWVIAGEEFLEMAGMTIVLYATLLLGIRIQSKSLSK
jgi:hypothetical protein